MAVLVQTSFTFPDSQTHTLKDICVNETRNTSNLSVSVTWQSTEVQLINRENRSARLIGFAQDNRFYIINKTNNCEKSQVNAKNRRPCDFCDFLQVHEKSQISQLRANLGISDIAIAYHWTRLFKAVLNAT